MTVLGVENRLSMTQALSPPEDGQGRGALRVQEEAAQVAQRQAARVQHRLAPAQRQEVQPRLVPPAQGVASLTGFGASDLAMQ